MKGMDYSKLVAERKIKIGAKIALTRKQALKESKRVLAEKGLLDKCTLPASPQPLSKNQKRKRGGAGKKFNQRMREKFEELTKAGIKV